MTGPDPAVSSVRAAVRRSLARLAPATRSAPLLVACSGGADSLALASAAVSVHTDAVVHAAVVDHRLQAGSAARACATAELLEKIGLSARVLTVEVAGRGGMEAAARRARYRALLAARPSTESPVLLGHTLDDQAETVLLGLGRGSGPRSIAGMREFDPPWLRPLLGIRRASTGAACAALGLPVWDDPHNSDPRFTRVRLRAEVLPLLEDVLGGGVAQALGRTAAQLREDNEALDMVAQRLLDVARDGSDLLVDPVVGSPPSVRRRALRSWLLGCGVTALSDEQLRRADELIGRWRGQGGPMLPGGLELVRVHGRLRLRPRAQ